MNKAEKYEKALSEVKALIDTQAGIIANMANISALLHQEFGFWWTGFYIANNDELVLGPFQGPIACTRIGFGKGVCGTAWQSSDTIIVPDVELFPGHIACSSESRSEIVVPVWKRGEIIAVLDIDSRELENFDGTDRYYLETICGLLSGTIDSRLIQYIDTEIIPRYDTFDKGHSREHAKSVMRQALRLCGRYDVSLSMVYCAAAYHDTGLRKDRETHHIESAKIIRADKNLRKWFNDNEINIIADAAEDHRASSGNEPRTIYGKLIAEADRLIDPEITIRRCIQYGIDHYPTLDYEGQFERTYDHIKKKYGENGYLKLWIPESDNTTRMKELRKIIGDPDKMRKLFNKIFSEESKNKPTTSK